MLAKTALQKHLSLYTIMLFSLTFYSQTMERLYQKMYVISDSDSIKELSKQQKSIEKTFSKTFTPIKTATSYRFIMMHESGWKENYPTPEARYKINNIYQTHDSIIFTGAELKQMFNLPESLFLGLQDSSKTLQFSISNTNAPPNLKSDQYLRISHGHYYPHGNQSSWMIDRLYYFEKVEK